MQSTVNLQTVGLYTEPNPLTVPEGALSDATNVNIQRDAVIEPRRGFGLFGTSFGTLTDRLKQLFVYKFRLLRQWGNTIEFDTGTLNNDGVELFEPFSGSFSEAQPGLRTKSVESNGNFYFTSSEGIKKISANSANQFTTAAGFINEAGGIKALDLSAIPIITQGNITGFLPQDSTVAYRVVWGTNDNNKNLILGVPSQRAEVYNTLTSLEIVDFNNLLSKIQNTANQPAPNNSIINESDYISSLILSSNATAADIRAALISLVDKLDNNIELAKDTAGDPLTISNITIANNVNDPTQNLATITFSSGNPTDYWISGSKIFLTGFAKGENSIDINGIQTLTSVTSTTVTFLTSATGNIKTFSSANIDIPNNQITLANHGFNNFDPVKITNSGGILPASVSATFLSTDVDTGTDQINIATPNFVSGDAIEFYNTGGSLPSPLVTNTTYYIKKTTPTSSDFTVYSDAGLTMQVVLTTVGSGTNTIVDSEFAIVSGTIYYVGNVSSGSFQLFTNSTLSIPVVLTATGTGTNTITYIMPITATKINSGEFRSLAQPPEPSDFPTDAELMSLQIYMQNIITILQTFPTTGTPPIISSYSQTNYITTLSITTSVNVRLDITIPKEVIAANSLVTTAAAPLYFFQIYRSPVTTASGTTPISELTASDELQQMYEAYPTAAELAAGTLTVIDDVPDQFLGANLYTNQASGVGIANANETPPFALDVAKFKNTVFYANTRTKYRMKLNLLGVVNMVADYLAGDTPQLVISDGVTTNVYSFVLGVQQTSQVVAVSDTADSLNGKYFLINSANNINSYYVWYKTSGGQTTDPGNYNFTITSGNATAGATYTNNSQIFTVESTISGGTVLTASGTGTPTVSGTLTKTNNISGDATITFSAFTPPDPAIAGRTGIEVFVDTGATATTVAQLTADTLNTLKTFDFTATITSPGTILITNSGEGSAVVATAGTSGFTVTTPTPGMGEDVTTRQVLLSNKVSPAQAIDETAKSLVNVINRSSTETIYAYYLSEASTVPGEMTLESRNLSTPQYYLLANNSDTGASFSPNLSPTTAIVSITAGVPGVNVVTVAAPHNLNTGDQVVFSATDSTPSADGLHTITYLSPTTFSINETITAPASKGEMISAALANAGDNEVKINRIYFSRLQQPEAVPLPNTLDVGDEDKPIYRIFTLRDSLFIFKEDGLYRISGETAPFSLQLFDLSCTLIAPDSLAVSKNVIYAWATQGVVNVTEAGISNPPISRPIDTNILPLISNNYPHFNTATWGVGYDSDNCYILFTVKDPTDTEATIAYRYNNLTATWTTWDKTDTCGIVNKTDDKLYFGAGDTNFMEQERKSFTRFDYADKELSTSLQDAQYNGHIINLQDVSKFSAGDVLVQNQGVNIYEYNALLEKLDNDTGLQSNLISTIGTGLTPTITTVGDHFLTTGDYVTISETLTTPLANGIFQVTVLNSTQFTITVPFAITTGGIAGLVKYSYYNTLKIANGANFEIATNALTARLNIEPSLIYKTSTGNISTNSAANPTIVTLTAPHNLGPVNNIRTVRISGNTGSTPSINGDRDVTIVSTTQFSINLNVTIAGSGGSFTTLDDYVTATAPKSGTITNIKVSDPSVVTSVNHGFVSDRYVQISGTNSSPVLDGNYDILVLDRDTFSVPMNVLQAGNAGSYSTLDGTFQDMLVNYNYITTVLNGDTGTAFKNYRPITTVTSQETIIVSVNIFTKQITIANDIGYIVGPMSVFEAISSTFTYSPVTFKDALNLKQISEATLMFENKAFSEATLGFSSDLIPEFKDVDFSGNGNGGFGVGSGKFGANFFGGGANAAPFRTYIPRDIQRCRYIVPRFTHSVAFEKYSINGLTLTGTILQSSRAYR